MHNHPQLTLDRLDRVMRDRIQPRVYAHVADVTIHAWRVDGDGEPVPPGHAIGFAPIAGRAEPVYEPFELGSTWGPAWSTTWFRIDGRVPENAGEVVELRIDLGWFDHSVGGHGEAMAYRPDGIQVKAIHPRHGWLRLRGAGADEALVAGDGSFTVFVEAAANPLLLGLPPFVVTHAGDKDTATEASFTPYELRSADIADFDQETWELVSDLEVVGGLAKELSQDEPRYHRLVDAIGRALDAYDPADAGAAENARAELADVLARPAHASAHRLSAIGHAHIDSAWLWPLRETRRKVARTVSNVLQLMDSDPAFVYAMSSAQQFAWLEEDNPELFGRMLERIREGRFIPVGGMWVESDAVVPTGESMVRQFTFGRRYFAERLGVEADGVWLPDSFGYSGALPQLARLAGYRWFLTQKISWNDANAFPHHSFSWEGIDGTRVFTHFPPVDTYAAEISAAELHHASRNFRDKARSWHSLIPFGYGDGGGGPTREMIGRIARFADLEGSPRVEVRAPSEFFAEAEAEYAANGPIPVWAGELYLELHRGTLTSQLAMKQGNRRSEAMLRTVEHLAAHAALRGADYPRAELDDIWRTVLLHQFHDILPGSSIAWVHREARETYRGLDERLRALADTAVEALGRGAGGRLAPAADGSWRVIREAEGDAVSLSRHGDGHTIDNGVLRVTFDARAHVTSILDLARDREIVPAGELAGRLTLFRDEPIRWDAWDVDRHVLGLGRDIDAAENITARIDEHGAAVVSVERPFGESRATVTYRLRPGSASLDISIDVDWHEREHLLKVNLPLDVRASVARFETQYGTVERAVGDNTSWDEARYEVNQHRYLHVAEPGYGVGVTNDSSHGVDVTRLDAGGTLVRPSILRAARFPDPGADIGEHSVRFGIVAADQPKTASAAYELGAPELASLPDVAPLVQLDLDGGSAAVDWVKLADDDSGDVIARIAELSGGRASGTLNVAPELSGATVVETDLHERPIDGDIVDLPRAMDGAGEVVAAGARVRLAPFQLTTLRLRTPRSGLTE